MPKLNRVACLLTFALAAAGSVPLCAGAQQTVPPPIRERAVALFEKVDATFGRRMAEALQVGVPIPKEPALV